MIALGLRLSLRGGREAGARLVFTALGVAVGVALLLLTLSGFRGLEAKDVREGWLLTNERNVMPSIDERTTDPLWWRVVSDSFGEDVLRRVEVAATGSRSPLPPGVSRLPAAGEYYVSPALADLLERTPDDQLRARFSGRLIGVLGEAALTSPTALTAVVGVHAPGIEPPAFVDHGGAPVSTWIQVRSMETAPKPSDYSLFFRLVLGLGAVGLLLPVLVFVATSTRLAGARREERFAALRLVGATPRQVNMIACVESVLAAFTGTLLGVVGFYVFRPLVARIPFTGEPFFTSDLSLGWGLIVSVVLGVPLAAAAVGLLALRRVRISPLGVSRRVAPRAPRLWRLGPAAAGLAALAVAPYVALPEGNAGIAFILVTFALIILGLAAAGPWLTMMGARLVTRSAGSDWSLLAGRRLSDGPGAAFRGVSGVVLAVFVGSVFVGVIDTALNEARANGTRASLPASSVRQWTGGRPGGGMDGAKVAALVAKLEHLEGVTAAVRLYAPASRTDAELGNCLVALADWRRMPGLAVPNGDGQIVTVTANDLFYGAAEPGSAVVGPEPAGGLAGRPVSALVVLTDGAASSIERVRTVLLRELPDSAPSVTVAQMDAASLQLVSIMQRMVDVGIILSLLIAGCSLAVSVAGGLIERKRPFSLLRLTGMPLGHLRRVVLIEAAVPLLLGTGVSAVVGILAAGLILRAIPTRLILDAPSGSYYALLAGGVAAAFAIVCATLPLLGRVTRIESARTE